jgi:acyl-CoA synthetase (AMP-forming)/AMP-acid ligase II/thioesterase domain-containing protein
MAALEVWPYAIQSNDEMFEGIRCNPMLDDFLALARRASETPDAIAILAPGRDPISYRDLWKHVQALQNKLVGHGVQRGQVTALVLPAGPEFLLAFLAVSGTGACAPLDPALTENEYHSCLRSLGARTLIVSDSQQTPAVRAALSLGIRILAIHTGETVSVVDPGDGAISGRTTDAALLLFTSATTDSPKLVPLTWQNLQAMAVHDSRALQLAATDRVLCLMPLFHLHGLATVLTQLSRGGSVICTAGFEPASFPHWLAEFRPTWFSSSPPLNRAILAVARQDPEIFRDSSLRFIRSGTAALEPQLLTLLEEAAGVPVLNGYGSTETGGMARNTLGYRKSGSVGRSSGLDLAIADPAGKVLPAECEGEIVVRGPSVTSGYLDNPEANQFAFRSGWFRTGDIGHLDQDGFLFLTGRLKEQINRGGDKISPQDVEAVLMKHPAVADAAACSIPHATLGEDVAAAVVLREGACASESELRQFAATQLAPFKVPRRIVLIDSIPRTSIGKPRRGILSEKLRSQKPSRDLQGTPALAPVENVLADIWRRILCVEHIEVGDDFFALGGDSLAVAAMLTEARRRLQTGNELLARVDFFDSPTIETLARIVVECGAKPEGAPALANRILPLRSTGSRLPFFCFPASAQDPYYLRHFSKSLDDEQPFFVVCHSDPVRDKRIVPVSDLARSSVEAIRRERPEGPYILGGHCYGGVVAYEAALQLMSQGQRVDCLVLFDAATPGYPKVHKQWRRYIHKAREMALALRPGKLAETAAALRLHIYALGRIFARRRKASASRVLTAIGSDVLVAGREDKTLNGMAMWEYTPREFPAPIVHFIAADQPVSTEVLSDPRLGWNDLARAGLAVMHVKGDHNSILAAENAAALAGALEALLSARELAHAIALPNRDREGALRQVSW